MIDRAKYLDKMYIPTRYPNAWSEGTPYEYYTEEEARRAIDISREVIEYIERRWKTLKSYEGG